MIRSDSISAKAVIKSMLLFKSYANAEQLLPSCAVLMVSEGSYTAFRSRIFIVVSYELETKYFLFLVNSKQFIVSRVNTMYNHHLNCLFELPS